MTLRQRRQRAQTRRMFLVIVAANLVTLVPAIVLGLVIA